MIERNNYVKYMFLHSHFFRFNKGGWGYVVLTITVIVQCIAHGLHMSSGILISAFIIQFRENLLNAGTIATNVFLS